MGSSYGLIVGIETYQDADLKRVLFAERDARAMSVALDGIGCASANQRVLINEKATATAIESEARQLLGAATSEDRCFIFFAGHGFSDGSHNYLAAHDTRVHDLEATCLRLQKLLAYVKASRCQRTVFFLDACHTGIKIEDTIRTAVAGVQIGDEEQFCAGFASCRATEKSYSSRKLEHGIWTFHLLEALNGRAKGALEQGKVTASKLQAYLADAVPRTILAEFDRPRPQNPRFFGSYERAPLIADVSGILAERSRVKSAQAANLDQVALVAIGRNEIRMLGGFDKRKGHFVPEGRTEAADSFVRRLAASELEEHIREKYDQLRERMKIKRREIASSIESEGATIRTPTFDYNVYVGQDHDDASMARWRYELVNIRDPSIIGDEGFNEVFRNVFNTVEVTYKGTGPDIDELVDQLEDAGYDVDCPMDGSWCSFSLDGIDAVVRVTQGAIELVHPSPARPRNLVEGFRAALPILMGQSALSRLLKA